MQQYALTACQNWELPAKISDFLLYWQKKITSIFFTKEYTQW